MSEDTQGAAPQAEDQQGAAPAEGPVDGTPQTKAASQATRIKQLEREVASLTTDLNLERARAAGLSNDIEALRGQLAAKVAAEVKQPQVEEAPIPEGTPRLVALTSPYGFIEDETDRHRTWAAGDMVADRHEIALLMARNAPVRIVEA